MEEIAELRRRASEESARIASEAEVEAALAFKEDSSYEKNDDDDDDSGDDDQ